MFQEVALRTHRTRDIGWNEAPEVGDRLDFLATVITEGYKTPCAWHKVEVKHRQKYGDKVMLQVRFLEDTRSSSEWQEWVPERNRFAPLGTYTRSSVEAISLARTAPKVPTSNQSSVGGGGGGGNGVSDARGENEGLSNSESSSAGERFTSPNVASVITRGRRLREFRNFMLAQSDILHPKLRREPSAAVAQMRPTPGETLPQGLHQQNDPQTAAASAAGAPVPATAKGQGARGAEGDGAWGTAGWESDCGEGRSTQHGDDEGDGTGLDGESREAVGAERTDVSHAVAVVRPLSTPCPREDGEDEGVEEMKLGDRGLREEQQAPGRQQQQQQQQQQPQPQPQPQPQSTASALASASADRGAGNDGGATAQQQTSSPSLSPPSSPRSLRPLLSASPVASPSRRSTALASSPWAIFLSPPTSVRQAISAVSTLTRGNSSSRLLPSASLVPPPASAADSDVPTLAAAGTGVDQAAPSDSASPSRGNSRSTDGEPLVHTSVEGSDDGGRNGSPKEYGAGLEVQQDQEGSDKTRETQQSTAATGSNTKNPVGIRREKGNDSCGAESSQLQVSSRHSPTAPGADTGAGTGPSDTKPVTSDSGASSSVLSEDVGVVGAGAGGVALAAVAVLQSTRELTPHMVDENDDGLFTVTVYRQYKKDARTDTLKVGTFDTAYEADRAGECFCSPLWQEYRANSRCAVCGSGFKGLKRKHHCRNCGRLVCGNCSNHCWIPTMLPFTYRVDKNERVVRVCSPCYESNERFREALLSGSSEQAMGAYEMGCINLRVPYSVYHGELPVHCAAAGGNVRLLSWLLEDRCCPVYADPKKMIPLRDNQHRSVMEAAAASGRTEVMRYLVTTKMFKPQNIEIIEDLWYALEMSLLEDDDDPQDEAKVNGKTLRARKAQNCYSQAYRQYMQRQKVETSNSVMASTYTPYDMPRSRGGSSDGLPSNPCLVCWSKAVDCTLVPCGHHCCCVDCAASFVICPICSTRIQQRIRTINV